MLNDFSLRRQKPLSVSALRVTPTAPVQSVNAEPTFIPSAPQDAQNRDTIAQEIEDSLPPAVIEQIQNAAKHVPLVMQMALMGMLYPENGGFSMVLPDMNLRLPDAATLFEAYLALDAMYGADWSELKEAVKTPWLGEIIQMLTESEQHIPRLLALRSLIFSEEMDLLMKHDRSEEDFLHSLKLFTLLARHFCDQQIDALESIKTNGAEEDDAEDWL